MAQRNSSPPAHNVVIPLVRRQEKRSEAVARTILHEIASSEREVGALLPSEAVMVQQFGVGRTTLREALRLLEVNGLVGLKPGPGGGPFVTEAGPREFGRIVTLHLQAMRLTVGDLVAAREAFEPVLARLAAASDDEAARAELALLVEQQRDLKKVSASDFDSDHVDFHERIASMAQTPVLELFGRALIDIIRLRVSTSLSTRQLRLVCKDHVAIGEAILARDGDEAEEAMRVHFQRLHGWLVAANYDMSQTVEWM